MITTFLSISLSFMSKYTPLSPIKSSFCAGTENPARKNKTSKERILGIKTKDREMSSEFGVLSSEFWGRMHVLSPNSKLANLFRSQADLLQESLVVRFTA